MKSFNGWWNSRWSCLKVHSSLSRQLSLDFLGLSGHENHRRNESSLKVISNDFDKNNFDNERSLRQEFYHQICRLPVVPCLITGCWICFYCTFREVNLEPQFLTIHPSRHSTDANLEYSSCRSRQQTSLRTSLLYLWSIISGEIHKNWTDCPDHLIRTVKFSWFTSLQVLYTDSSSYFARIFKTFTFRQAQKSRPGKQHGFYPAHSRLSWSCLHNREYQRKQFLWRTDLVTLYDGSYKARDFHLSLQQQNPDFSQPTTLDPNYTTQV